MSSATSSRWPRNRRRRIIPAPGEPVPRAGSLRRRLDLPPQAGRYHLYVSRACPWAHRTMIARDLMGLEDAIGVSFVDPIRDERGLGVHAEASTSMRSTASITSARRTSATDRSYHARVTVPVLWDKRLGHDRLQRIRGHPADAGHRVRAAGRASDRALSRALQGDIDALNDRIYENVNNAVYKAGFALQPGGLRARGGRHCSRRSTSSTQARRPPLPVRVDACRDRLAAVHHARAVRRRLPDPLQVLDPQADRVRVPVAVCARPVPVAGRRGDGRFRRDPCRTITAPIR